MPARASLGAWADRMARIAGTVTFVPLRKVTVNDAPFEALMGTPRRLGRRRWRWREALALARAGLALWKEHHLLGRRKAPLTAGNGCANDCHATAITCAHSKRLDKEKWRKIKTFIVGLNLAD